MPAPPVEAPPPPPVPSVPEPKNDKCTKDEVVEAPPVTQETICVAEEVVVKIPKVLPVPLWAVGVGILMAFLGLLWLFRFFPKITVSKRNTK